jgi:hypothetical protein
MSRRVGGARHVRHSSRIFRRRPAKLLPAVLAQVRRDYAGQVQARKCEIFRSWKPPSLASARPNLGL